MATNQQFIKKPLKANTAFIQINKHNVSKTEKIYKN